MSPSPLSPNVLHVLLQYISPPSQLTQPIPPHLLSKPVLQRHHFLHLAPEQPDEYLCWPSSPEKRAHVIDLLESRPRPLDDHEPTVYPVQYSFDGEDFFAHVDLSPNASEGLRVILQWDESGEWRYHNTDLMPFPPGCRPVLEDVLVPPSPPHPISVHTLSTPSYTRSYEVSDLQDDSDDDDYWNAYGATDVGDSFYGQDIPASAKDAASSEDAYWARYASVQGTADSTIPSPVPRRKQLPPMQSESEGPHDSPVPLPVPVRIPSEDTYAEPLPIPPSIMPRPRSNSRWDPASPTQLAHLLSTISPRESPAESPAPGGSFYPEEEALSSPTIGGSDSELSSSPGLGLEGTDIVAVTAPVTSDPASVGASYNRLTERVVEVQPVMVGVDEDGIPVRENDEDEADLRAALASVWKLWKKTRSSAVGLGSAGDTQAREVFIRTAQAVVEGL